MIYWYSFQTHQVNLNSRHLLYHIFAMFVDALGMLPFRIGIVELAWLGIQEVARTLLYAVHCCCILFNDVASILFLYFVAIRKKQIANGLDTVKQFYVIVPNCIIVKVGHHV